MTTSNINDATVDMDDLDNFETAFFKTGSKATEPVAKTEDPVEDEIDEIEDDALATSEDEDELEDEDEEEDEDPKPEPKPKNRKSAKDRIEELVAKTRESERREAALIARLEQLEARKEEDKPQAKTPLREVLSQDGPSPDETLEDGEAKYPLGEFDPKFIRDLTRFTIEQERAAEKTRDSEAQTQRMIQTAQDELKTQWADKVAKAEESLPDLREKLSDMSEAFVNIDPTYGEYLAATIMSCDAGPEIMYYLSQNIGEAQKIVASGPAAATLAIGRLEARLGTDSKEPKRNTKQVTKAPLPPETRTRGHGSKFTVSPDTDDLDAFEREFFKKK